MEQVQDNSQTHYVYVKEKDGCFTSCLKLGCGFIMALWIISFFIAFALALCGNEEADPIEYFQVTNGKKEVTIHTGMPKDSVILLLGQPTEFDSNNYRDEITYNYGMMGLSSLTIEFENGKVSSVRKGDNENIYDNFNSLMNDL